MLAGAALLLLTGCTQDDTPDVPTDGTLTVADLPEGSWTGPYEGWTDAPIDSRPPRCTALAQLWSPSLSPEKKGTAAFADGDTVRQDGTSVVCLLVSCPTADPPEVTADGLLDRAEEASANLQPVQ